MLYRQDHKSFHLAAFLFFLSLYSFILTIAIEFNTKFFIVYSGSLRERKILHSQKLIVPANPDDQRNTLVYMHAYV